MELKRKIPKNIQKLITAKTLIILNKKDKKSFNAKKIIKELKGNKFKDLIEVSIKDKTGINKLNSRLKNCI